MRSKIQDVSIQSSHYYNSMCSCLAIRSKKLYLSIIMLNSILHRLFWMATLKILTTTREVWSPKHLYSARDIIELQGTTLTKISFLKIMKPKEVRLRRKELVVLSLVNITTTTKRYSLRSTKRIIMKTHNLSWVEQIASMDLLR